MINSIQASKDAATTWAIDMLIASHYRGSRWTENNCWFVHSLSIHLTACILSSLDVSAFLHLKIHTGGYSYHVEIVAKSSKNRPQIVLNWNYQFSGREVGRLSKHTVVCKKRHAQKIRKEKKKPLEEFVQFTLVVDGKLIWAKGADG